MLLVNGNFSTPMYCINIHEFSKVTNLCSEGVLMRAFRLVLATVFCIVS